MEKQTGNRRLTIFFLIFTLSGFSGLIYESIWTHYIKLFLGHAAYAQALVLALFMGGMAVGSLLCAHYSVRWKNLLIGYALTEGLIGLFGLTFHNVFESSIHFAYFSMIPNIQTSLGVHAAKWGISILLILPQSILLGMTFPLMSGGILRLYPMKPGRLISMLYFTNSIGASIGVISSGFILIGSIGLPWTIRVAGIINVVLAVLVVRFAGSGSSAPAPPVQAAGETRRGLSYYILLAVSFGTGAASFIYEIGWIRMLSLVLGSSTHAFELMLSAFIMGLAFGGFWIRKRVDQAQNPALILALVQIIMGFCALMTLPVYGFTFDIMQWLMKILSKTDGGYALFNVSSHVLALVIMLPATLCAGMTLPLITYAVMKHGDGEKSIGKVYGSNTIGSIMGVFIAVYVGMPLLGLKGLIIMGASLDVGLGLALLWFVARAAVSQRIRIAATFASLCMVVISLAIIELNFYKMASGVYRKGDLLQPADSDILYYRDGKTATTSMLLEQDVKVTLRTNGKPDASFSLTAHPTPDEYTMILLGAIPMFLNPDARTVANIGLGSGITTNTILQNPGFTVVDTVEIEESFLEAARRIGGRVKDVFEDPRSRIYIEDAKTFFTTRKKKYDIIISEPSNPWVSGVSGLFSDEFYNLVQHYLTDEGLFVQWLQLYEIDMNLVSSVFKAISSNFSDYAVYAPNYGDIVIVAKKAGSVSYSQQMGDFLFSNPGIAADLKRINITAPADISMRFIGGKATLEKLFKSYPAAPNSDYYPVLDQNAVRARFLGLNAQDLIKLTTEPLPLAEMLSSPIGRMQINHTAVIPTRAFPRTKKIGDAITIRDFLLSGAFDPVRKLPENVLRDAEGVRRMFHQCLEDYPENRKIYLVNTAKRMVPYLPSSELHRIWNSLESGRCSADLTETEGAYVSFFKAIGNRDAMGIIEHAGKVIAYDKSVTPIRLQYIIAASMLAHLSLGDEKESLRLIEAYRHDLFGESPLPFIFRYLYALSLQ